MIFILPKNTIKLFLLTAFIFSTACSHIPSQREKMVAQNDREEAFINTWDEGNAMTEKGKKMVKRGENLIRKGTHDIKIGNNKIEKGNALMNHSAASFWEDVSEENIHY